MDPLYQDCTLLHVDADGFFAGVEQALTPSLRGRPVVTGAERGIIAAASYEAKARGIKRGLQLHEAVRQCPGLVVLPSDYETYSLYSRRMFAILRRFTPQVEEYSIDEAFADLAGCGAVLGMPLEAVAEHLRLTVQRELGLTVSVGISLNKTLAKLCSKFRKPNGQTILRREHLPLMLQRTPVDRVWGIGRAGSARLARLGVATAWDLARLEASTVRKLLHKPGYETWRELHGWRVFPLEQEASTRYGSMMKGHTFAPPSDDVHLVRAEAMRNLTAVLAKLRRRRHLAGLIGLAMRLRDYTVRAGCLPLPFSTAHDAEAAPVLLRLFDEHFTPGPLYRSTMVWLGALVPEQGRQMDLFEETPARQGYGRLDETVDRLNQRYGQGTVAPALLLDLRRKPLHSRDARPDRYRRLARQEGARHLALPRLTLDNPV
jgi:DNA polymerase-4/DNA polymerase V